MIAGIVIDSLARWRRFIRHCIREAADRVYLTKEDLLAARPDGGTGIIGLAVDRICGMSAWREAADKHSIGEDQRFTRVRA